MAGTSSSSNTPEMHCIQPKTDCPHVDLVLGIEKLSIDATAPCKQCNNVTENWLCLQCSFVFCSRYVNQHMVEHNQQSNHVIALSFSDISVWCYSCDSYITSPLLNAICKGAEIAKFS